MKDTLQFVLYLVLASSIGGTFVYLIDCAFGDSLRAWLAVNPDGCFMMLAMAVGFSICSFRAGYRAGQGKGGRHD